MNWKISVLLLIVLITSCRDKSAKEVPLVEENYLIEAEELKQIVDQPNIKVLDFRKKEFYNSEHILGALSIWRNEIENTDYPYGGMMPTRNQMELLFGKLGIKSDDTIIIYDDNGLCDAARLWWILQNYGFKNMKLLHGGISSWKDIGGELSTETPIVTPTNFILPNNVNNQYYASKEQVKEAISSGIVILDTRTPDEYSGKRQKSGAFKGGRIPSSLHIDWVEAINYNGDKRLRPLEELKTIYGNLGISKNDTIMVYCHSGVRSAHTTFVLTQLLGFKNVRNYDGSWTEWSHFKDLPMERDSLTTILN